MSSAHLKLPPTQRALQEADEQLAAARRALGVCQAAIVGWRPVEANKQAQAAVAAIQAARRELQALFDARVASDSLYGERSRA